MRIGNRSGLAVPAAVAALLFTTGAAAQAVRIEVLSSRAEMVSGGDALVQVSAPGAVKVTLNGRDVTSAFKAGSTAGTMVGLVEGMTEGRNTVRAEAGRASAQQVLVNHPVSGPIVAGPHLNPLLCMTVENDLGPALDANCSAATKVEYFYKSNAPAPAPAPAAGPPPAAREGGAAAAGARDGGAPRGGGGGGRGGGGGGGASPFKALPAGNALPADVDTITTADGRSIPYVVRVESGTIDRAVYRIAIVDDPRQGAGQPWKPGAGWNGKLVYSFGAGCGASYTQGRNTAVGAINDELLKRGFAHATSTFNVQGLNCDDARSGESLMMVKEHFIERYGVPVWTMGLGGSGGSMQQQLIAQNFPGLLNGLLPSQSFPDLFSIWNGAHDCALMTRYFGGNGSGWSDEKRTAVLGSTIATCQANEPYLSSDSAARAQTCGLPADQVYDPVKNPKGARCTAWDTNAASFGRDKDGKAQRTIDNVGVQYGLLALRSKAITPAEFLDLNARIGGFDNDGNATDAREVASTEGLRLAYATGRINTGGGSMGSIPIIHYRGYADDRRDVHDRFRELSIRERLKKVNGNADNQVIWLTGGGPAQQQVGNLAIDTMSQWLDALVKDTSKDAALVKTLRAKPATAVDACWDRDGKRIDDKFSMDPSSRCNTVYPPHTNPRIAAGGPLADDILKCQLKQPSRSDYADFSDTQWTELKRVFPQGVCDYGKPGVKQGTITGTYQKLPL